MNKKEIIEKFFETTEATYYRHKKQNRPVIRFIEKYFTEEDLKEFLETGQINRLEENTISNTKLEIYEGTLENHALYSAKYKLSDFFKGRILIKNILIDVLNQMSSNKNRYTIENTKQSLIEQLKGSEINWLKTKTQGKIDLLSEFVENNISDIEAYAMIKKPEVVLNLKEK